jgi:hypothetical protein
MPIKAPTPDAEAIAIAALGFLAGDDARLDRFMSLTGLDLASLRAAAQAPGFLGSVLDYLVADEALLLAFAAENRLRPEAIAEAAARLAGRTGGA